MGRPISTAKIRAQCRHQVRLQRQWTTVWIPAIFAFGFAAALLGLLIETAPRSMPMAFTPRALVFAFFSVFFAWTLVLFALGPHPLRPRVVPYFRQAMGPHGGLGAGAFVRGRALHRDLAGLDELAERVHVAPLSSFGFADDFYEQEPRWHAPAAGLVTVERLQANLVPSLASKGDLLADLEALRVVLLVAAAQGVDFCLVLRLHANDSLQGVMSHEARAGSFW